MEGHRMGKLVPQESDRADSGDSTKKGQRFKK